MSRFFVSPDSPEGWAAGLASPGHWRQGFSAHSLAHTWHRANGFPQSVSTALAESSLGELEFIAGIPEYEVPLPGGDAASQSDLFVLARAHDAKTVAMAVEGKALEAFGDDVVADWRIGMSDRSTTNRAERLRFLLGVLGLEDDEALGGQRYQLLHRAASPLIEAKRLHASVAVMLVHSFGGQNKWFEEFASFARLLGAEVQIGSVVRAATPKVPLYLGWVSDPHPETA
jgi:hypothetical protein